MQACAGVQVAFACASFSRALWEEGGRQQVAGLPLEALLQLLSSEALQASSELDVAQVNVTEYPTSCKCNSDSLNACSRSPPLFGGRGSY